MQDNTTNVPAEWMPEDEFQATVNVLNEAIKERKRQHAKFGQRNIHPVLYASILNEEVGEVNKEVCEFAFANIPDQPTIHKRMRTELIQVIAVAAAMVTCMDRQIKP